MRETFQQALDNLRLQAAGWLLEGNLRGLSAATADEVSAFSEVWPHLADSDRYQLASALVELAESNEQTTFEALFGVMIDDDSPEVRCAAVAGLSEAVDAPLADRLIAFLATDSDAQVRAEAASALGTFLADSESEFDPAGLRRRVEDALLETINADSEDVTVRRRALESYGYAEDPYADDVLRDAYDSDEDEIRSSAIFAMGRRLDEEWLTIIHQELTNEVDEIRLAAIYAASEIGAGASVPHLLRVIGEDPSDEVRVAAVYGLAEIESPEAERLLQDLLESNDAIIQTAAEDALEMWNAREDLGDMLLFDYGPPDADDSGNGHGGF